MASLAGIVYTACHWNDLPIACAPWRMKWKEEKRRGEERRLEHRIRHGIRLRSTLNTDKTPTRPDCLSRQWQVTHNARQLYTNQVKTAKNVYVIFSISCIHALHTVLGHQTLPSQTGNSLGIWRVWQTINIVSLSTCVSKKVVATMLCYR